MKSYLTFREIKFTGKTYEWMILNGVHDLGRIRWHAPWRRYCFYPNPCSIWDYGCLREVAAFIDAEMAKRKAA